MAGLYDAAMVQCRMIHKTTTNDSYGGETTSWVRGAVFNAAISFDTSVQARIGLSQGVKNMYTIYTKKSKVFTPYEVFERVSDGKVFRIVSDGNDSKTPASASIDMRTCTAEEWAIPGTVTSAS